MPARYVCDYCTPSGRQCTINVDVEARTFLVSFERAHPLYQTWEIVQLEYGFETEIGREIGGWIVSRMPPRIASGGVCE